MSPVTTKTATASRATGERLTGNLRWVAPTTATAWPAVLQQEWQNLATHQTTWRDVPTVHAPVGS